MKEKSGRKKRRSLSLILKLTVEPVGIYRTVADTSFFELESYSFICIDVKIRRKSLSIILELIIEPVGISRTQADTSFS